MLLLYWIAASLGAGVVWVTAYRLGEQAGLARVDDHACELVMRATEEMTRALIEAQKERTLRGMAVHDMVREMDRHALTAKELRRYQDREVMALADRPAPRAMALQEGRV